MHNSRANQSLICIATKTIFRVLEQVQCVSSRNKPLLLQTVKVGLAFKHNILLKNTTIILGFIYHLVHKLYGWFEQVLCMPGCSYRQLLLVLNNAKKKNVLLRIRLSKKKERDKLVISHQSMNNLLSP